MSAPISSVLTLTFYSTRFPMMSMSTGCSLTWDVIRDRRQLIPCLLFGINHFVTLTSTNLPFPRLYFSSKSHTNPATCIVPPPGRYGLLSYTRIIYYVLTDQGGKLSCTWESFLLILNSYFLPLRTLQVPWGVRVEPMPTQVKSTHPHWIHLFVCLVCLGVVLYVFGRQ